MLLLCPLTLVVSEPLTQGWGRQRPLSGGLSFQSRQSIDPNLSLICSLSLPGPIVPCLSALASWNH